MKTGKNDKHSELYSRDSRRMFIFLMVLTIASAFTFQGWRILLNNYAVDVVGINGKQMGIIQSVREIPGFLAFLVIYLLLLIREHRLAALSLALLGAGVGLVGLLPSFYGLVFTTLVMSFGFHYYETLNSALTLQYFNTTQVPLVLGRLRSVSAATNIAVGIFILGLSYVAGYPLMFALIGFSVAAVGIWCAFQDPTHRRIVPQKKKMVLRRRYWLFYALTFMAGARRQIFVAFAVFLLVQKFGFTIREIAILFFVNNAINYFLMPLIGRAINHFGERKVLSLEYGALMIIFVVYAFTDSKTVVAIMYVLDFIFFNFSMAIKSYFQKIADPADITPSMAVGFTINHVVAVIVPFLGGMVWMVDYKIPFLGGAALAGISFSLVQLIRPADAPRRAEKDRRASAVRND